jgi:hypothetical protein
MVEPHVRMRSTGRLVCLLPAGVHFLLLLVILAGCGQPATRDQASGAATSNPPSRELPPDEGPALVQPPAPPEGDPEEQPPNSAPEVGSGPGDVLQEPAGLLCRDLEAKGYSYAEAIDYWQAAGQPSRMDIDGNGIPCETVYPAAEVQRFWGR